MPTSKEESTSDKTKSDGDNNQIAAIHDENHPHHHHHHHVHWDNPIEFLMTCVGFAVGLGNVWRFPFLCYKNGGSAFVIAFVIMLFLIGLPLFFLELTISQFSKCGPLLVWKITPLFRGIGMCSVLLTSFVVLYYNVIISYCIVYLIASFVSPLPWTGCNNWWNDEKCFTGTLNSTNAIDMESSSKQFYYKYVLEMSDGIDNPIGLNWKLTIALLIAWLGAFLCLIKGVQSLGKVSYITAIFPYIMLFALIIRGVTLPGSMKGIVYFIGTIDWSKLTTLKTWIDAASQVYFCLSIGQGGLITLGKHNKFNYNHQRTALFVSILDGLTGIIAGFAVFSDTVQVLGFMAEETKVEIDQLAVGGPGLSFIVYPEALSLMPFPYIWCVFFFLMMITIGLGSLLSLTECILDSLVQFFGIIQPRKKTLFRFGACMFFFFFGLSMTTNAGYYLLNLIESYCSVLPSIVIATLEAICLCWFYGTKRIEKDIELMLDVSLNIYWKICFRFFTPVLAIIMCIITIVSNTEVVLGSYKYPIWAHILGWLEVAIILSPLFRYGIASMMSGGIFRDIYKLTQPGPDWKPVPDMVHPPSPLVPSAQPNKETTLSVDVQPPTPTNLTKKGVANEAFEMFERV